MKQIVYFTDSMLEEELAEATRKQILKAANGIPIISVSQKPLVFGKNICVGYKPICYLNLYEALLTGLEATPEDSIIYVCEHDVFYHPSHFEFVPSRKNRIYYNLNRYYWKQNETFYLKTIGKRALSQAVACRDVLIDHVRDQVSKRRAGISAPCEGPFTNFTSEYPNIDIRHRSNFSRSGSYKNSNKSRRYWDLDYWGTPREFQNKTGYKNKDIETDVHLHRLFNNDKKDSPVIIPKFNRWYLVGLFHSLGFKKGAEIGVKRGDYSHQICKGMKDVHLKCVDNYLPGPNLAWDESEGFINEVRFRLKDFDVQHIIKSSMHAAEMDVAKGSLDFVYIDADHSFDSVMQDIIVWAQRVRVGGIVSGHDYDLPGVKEAVDVYTKVHDLEYFVTETGESYPDSSPSWFFAIKEEG